MEQARRTPADVVVLHVLLPDGSGLDALPRLKEPLPNARVIVISGLADPSTQP